MRDTFGAGATQKPLNNWLGQRKGETNMRKMRNIMSMTIAVLATAFLIGSTPVNAAENLGSIIRENRWDRMVGTWVDAETNGKKLKSVTTWRFKDHVVKTVNHDFQQGKNETSLMIYSPKKGEVFIVSADDKGGSASGQWTFNKDEAVLNLGFVTPEKQEGLLQLRYKFIDDDTMIATVVLPKPIVIKMIRLKEQSKKTK